jgi:hypothetical protein
MTLGAGVTSSGPCKTRDTHSDDGIVGDCGLMVLRPGSLLQVTLLGCAGIRDKETSGAALSIPTFPDRRITSDLAFSRLVLHDPL